MLFLPGHASPAAGSACRRRIAIGEGKATPGEMDRRKGPGNPGARQRIDRQLEELDRGIRDCLEDIRNHLRELEESMEETPGEPPKP